MPLYNNNNNNNNNNNDNNNNNINITSACDIYLLPPLTEILNLIIYY